MTDPTRSSTPPPAPPYAAPATVPHPPAGSGYSGAQQPYPGAPPVWAAPPAPPPPGSPALAGTALALAIVGGIAAFVPFAGGVFAWAFVVPAVVLAIVALVRRAPGRGMSIASLVVSGVAALVSALWSVGFFLFGSMLGGGVPDEVVEEYSYPSLGIAAGAGGGSREDALAFGTEVTIVDDNNGQDVWSMTVGAPEDATADVLEGSAVPPLNGAYVAVPVELTNVGDEAIDLEIQYEYSPYTWLLTGDGGRAETTYLAGGDRYPMLGDAGIVEPGESVVSYDLYDVGPAVTTTGYLVVDLDSGAQVFWGP